MAVTGAVRIDADGDGKFTSARTYAARICRSNNYNCEGIMKQLKAWDSAVALHAADELYRRAPDAFTSEAIPAAHQSAEFIAEAFDTMLEAHRTSQRARAGAN